MEKIYKLLLAFTCLFSSTSFAADYYWVGGSGKWSQYSTHWAKSSGGNVFHTQVPTATDNVIFDSNSLQNSATVNLDQTQMFCQSFLVNSTDNLIFVNTNTSSSLNIYGSFALNKKTAFNFIGKILFKGNSNNTISQRGGVFQPYPEVTLEFDAPGASWTITDSLNVYGINLISGTFEATGKLIKCVSFQSRTTNQRVLKLSNSRIVIYSTWHITSTNLVYDFNKSNLKLNSAAQGFSSPGILNYDTITTEGGNIHDACNIKNFLITKPISLLSISYGSTIDNLIGSTTKLRISGIVTVKNMTINNNAEIVIDGELKTDNLSFPNASCTNMPTLTTSRDFTSNGKITKTSGQLIVSNIYLRNIAASGGASFIASNVVDMGSNSGWQITTLNTPDLYWVGGSGNWNEAAHWSLSSGGPAYGCTPTYNTNVYFDNNSFSADGQTVTVPSTVSCKNFDFTKVTVNARLTYMPVISGSLFLKGNMSTSSLSSITFDSYHNDNIINAKGNKIGYITFYGPGTWTMSDSLYTESMYLRSGKLLTANYKLNCNYFSASPGFKLNLGSSTLSVRQNYDNSMRSADFDAGTSIVNIYKPSYPSLGMSLKYYNLNLYSDATIQGVNLGNCIFNNIYLGNSANLRGNFSCDTLYILNGINTNFESVVEASINSIQIIGNTCSSTSLTASDATPVTIVKPNGILSLENVSLKNIIGSGGATFKATNTIDLGGNINWDIQKKAAKTYYWVGNSGKWSDTLHWASASGGIPTGGCGPSISDNVIFDQNSFMGNNSIITIDNSNATCRDFKWLSEAENTKIQGQNLTIAGSFILNDKPKFLISEIKLYAQDSAVYNTADVTLPSLSLSGTSKTINGFSLSPNSNLSIGAGKFDLSNTRIYAQSINFGYNQDTTYLNLDSSIFVCQGGLGFSDPEYIVTIKKGLSISASKSIYATSFNNLGVFPFPFKLLKVRNTCQDIISVKCETYILSPSFSFDRIEIDNIGNTDCYVATVKELISYADKTTIGAAGIINYADLHSTETVIPSDVMFGHLKLNPGTAFKIDPGKTVTINDHLEALGKPAFPISIMTTSQGAQGIISKASGTNCFDYLYISDIKVTGGAQFIAGSHSSNIANNSGWDFTSSCVPFTAIYNAPVCIGGSILFSASAVTVAGTYNWTGPNGFSSNLAHPTISNATTDNNGIYTVTGDGRTASVYVKINQVDTAVIKLSNNQLWARDNQGQNMYTWYKNDQIIQETSNSPYFQFPGNGTYYAKITTPENCSYTTQKITIGDDEIYVAMPYNLSAQGHSTSSIHLQWNNSFYAARTIIERSLNPGDGFAEIITVSGLLNSFIDEGLNENTTYYYRLRNIINGNYSSYTVVENAKTFITTGFNSKDLEKHISIYPNPTSGVINIETNYSLIDAVTVSDIIGNIVFNKEYDNNTNNITINLADLPKGVYILQLNLDGNQSKLIRKIVLE